MKIPKHIPLPGNKEVAGHRPRTTTTEDASLWRRVASHLPVKVRTRKADEDASHAQTQIPDLLQSTLGASRPRTLRLPPRAKTSDARPLAQLPPEVPAEVWPLIAENMDKESLGNYRRACKAAAYNGAVSVRGIRVHRREDLIPALEAFATGGIERVSAQNCDLGPADAAQIATCRSITSLRLHGNRLRDTGVQALSSMPFLNRLDIGDNGVGAAGVRAAAAVSSLNSLGLRSNNLGDADVLPLRGAVALERLDLSFNNLSDAGAQAVAAIASLESIDLEANQVGDVGAQAVAANGSITSAVLTGNQVGILGARALAVSPSLKVLHLSQNVVEDGGGLAIAGSSSIKELRLARNGLTDISGVPLASNRHLEKLDLMDNNLTDAVALAAAANPSLKDLNLLGNPGITSVGRAALEAERDRFEFLQL
jgi:Leucine rich repeat/Leucine Rich repeat